MAFGQNPFNPPRSLATLAAIHRRSRELLAYQARQEAAQPTTEHGELLVEDQAYLPEESRPFPEQEEEQEEENQVEQQERQDPQHAYPDEASEPSVPPPPGPSAPPPP